MANSTHKKRDSERSKRLILESAVTEFSNYGLGGARVDRIAERAGVNKRLLYHHYNNKDDLFLAVLEKTYSDIREART